MVDLWLGKERTRTHKRWKKSAWVGEAREVVRGSAAMAKLNQPDVAASSYFSVVRAPTRPGEWGDSWGAEATLASPTSTRRLFEVRAAWPSNDCLIQNFASPWHFLYGSRHRQICSREHWPKPTTPLGTEEQDTSPPSIWQVRQRLYPPIFKVDRCLWASETILDSDTIPLPSCILLHI